jgi:hypothetical protein
VDLASVTIIALVAGAAGGAIGAALVGTVEGMLRRRMAHSARARWIAYSRWVGSGSVMSPEARPHEPFERPDPDDGLRS